MNISELHPDQHNARKRTARGRKAIESSLRDLGAGRSIVLDRHNRVIAGNGTLEAASKLGLVDVQVIESDGSQLIAVKRIDLDLDNDDKARKLAIADNRSAEFAEWDASALKELSGLDLQPFFTAPELADITGDKSAPANNASAEWAGMPEFTSEDQMGIRQIIVHFADHEAVAEFARRLEHSLTKDTKSIWFPRAKRLDLQSLKYRTDA